MNGSLSVGRYGFVFANIPHTPLTSFSCREVVSYFEVLPPRGWLIYARRAPYNIRVGAADLTDYDDRSMTYAETGQPRPGAWGLADAGFGEFHGHAQVNFVHHRVEPAVAGGFG